MRQDVSQLYKRYDYYYFCTRKTITWCSYTHDQTKIKRDTNNDHNHGDGNDAITTMNDGGDGE